MAAIPPWIQTGLLDLDTKLSNLYLSMKETMPTEEVKADFFITLAAYHDLHRIGKHLAPIQAAVAEAVQEYQPPVLVTRLDAHEVIAEPNPVVIEAKPLSDPNNGVYVGTFQRRARGGVIITDVETTIPVTEGRYQQMWDHYQLQHGDLIQAKEDGMYEDTQTIKWYFTILDHCGSPNTDRKETYGALEYIDSSLCVVRAHGLDIFVDGKDVRYHNASEGDVVQLAYMQSEVKQASVRGFILRRLKDEELELAAPADITRRRKPRGTQRVDNGPEVMFEGNPSVLVIGGRNWQYFRDGLRKYGAEPEYQHGFDTDHNLTTKLLGYDLVVVVHTNTSHENHDKAKDVVPKERLHVTGLENWSGFRDQLLIPTIIPKWNRNLVSAAD